MLDVHHSDELSDLDFITDYLKVIDFIEEMVDLTQSIKPFTENEFDLNIGLNAIFIKN